MIGAGYLALLLALVQPYILLSRQTKKSLAFSLSAAESFYRWDFPDSLCRTRLEPIFRDRLGKCAGGFRRSCADSCVMIDMHGAFGNIWLAAN